MCRREEVLISCSCVVSLFSDLLASELEPIAKGSPIGLQRVTDRYVSLDYVEKAGITQRLREEGYSLVWSRADEEATRIDLEGWQYVEEVARDGSMVRFKVKDQFSEYVVLLKKPGAPKG